MSLMEQMDKQIPDYYPTMYLDGYTPAQILHSAKRGMYQNHIECKGLDGVQSAVEAALHDMFKDWK